MYSTNKVKKMIKQINMNKGSKYKVTETSARHGEHTYTVHNLVAEYEAGGVYCGDGEEVIYDNGYALMGFLVDFVIDIIIEDKIIEIIFENNIIIIELI